MTDLKYKAIFKILQVNHMLSVKVNGKPYHKARENFQSVSNKKQQQQQQQKQLQLQEKDSSNKVCTMCSAYTETLKDTALTAILFKKKTVHSKRLCSHCG